MPFRFAGDCPLTYPQYIDASDDTTLTASPGEVYDMRPAGSLPLAVPPADGRWLAVTAREAAAVKAAEMAAAAPPAVVVPAPAARAAGDDGKAVTA